MNNLPVGPILSQAFLFPAIHWRDFLRIALAPATYFAIWLLILHIFLPATPTIVSVFLPIFGSYFVGGLLVVPFIVSWHRLILLGAPATHRKWFPLLEKRDLRFAIYVLICVVMYSVVSLILSFVFVPFLNSIVPGNVPANLDVWAMNLKGLIILLGIYAILLFAFFFFCHWLLVFPGITVDETTPLSVRPGTL